MGANCGTICAIACLPLAEMPEAYFVCYLLCIAACASQDP
jgi:hypothetical protein